MNTASNNGVFCFPVTKNVKQTWTQDKCAIYISNYYNLRQFFYEAVASASELFYLISFGLSAASKTRWKSPSPARE